MASLTNSFLTNGPIPGDPGDITAGSAYHVVWRQIGRAISDAAEKHDENSKKIVDELKTLREHFKQEAEKAPNKRISELPPDVAREFLEVSRLIKDIKGAASRPSSLPPTSISTRHGHHHGHHHGVVNSAFEGKGPIGVVAMAGADALVPGSGIIVKAVQENSQLIRDTFHAFGHAASLFRDSFKMFKDTFKAIHNFLDPNHPFSLVKALSKLFGDKGGGGGGILSHLMSTAVGLAIRSIIPAILSAIGAAFTAVAGVGLAFIISHLIKKYFTRDSSGWGTALSFGSLPKGWGIPQWLWGGGEDSLFSLKLDPKIWGSWGGTHSFLNPEGGTVPGGQGTQPFNLNTRSIKAPESFNEGFNFNTGIASDESDTIIQLMMKQTQLLGEILKALLSGGGGQGYIRGLQSGGTAAPGEKVLVGEDGAENIQIGGRSGTVNGPMLLQAGKDPIQVNPLGQTRSLTTGNVGPPQVQNSFFSSLPLRPNPSSSFVSPIGNPNVRQDMIERQIRAPGEEGNYVSGTIRMNNPGAISTSTTFGGEKGDPRGAGGKEGGWYTKYNTPEEGMRAQMLTLQTYQESGRNTIRSIIEGRPGHPNEAYAVGGQKEYEAHLSKLTGRGVDEPWNFYDPQEYIRYGKASSAHEGGRGNISPYTDEAFERAMYLRDDKGGSVVNPDSPLPPGPKELSSKGVVVGQKTPEELAALKAKASPTRQDATLPVQGGGPTAGDTHRNINALKAKERQLKSGKDTKQSPQQPQQGRAASRKQASHKALFTNVGMVALSSGSGFG